MTERRIRWGILSTANIGRLALIPAIKAARNGELVAVASRDGDKATAFARDAGISRAHGRYEELLESEDIDAIYNPLPNSLHREWSIKAAEAGKHVLCEKPLALDAAECREMEDAAERNGVRLMEAFMYRFHPRSERAIQLVREGAIGPLRAVYASFTFRLTNPENIRMKPELGGGSLMDVGCYCVNVARTLAGQEPLSAQATANWAATGVDEQMAGTLRFPDGLLAQFDCALSLERREFFHAAGTEGHLEVNSAFLPGSDETTIEEFHGRDTPRTHEISGADEYRLMVEHFADAVLQGEPFRYPAAEAAGNMRTIEALYRSARDEGRPQLV